MRGTIVAVFWLTLLSAGLGSCASTPTPTVWKEEAYLGGPVRKPFIIGAFPEAGMRKLVEKEFVLQLGMQGTEAVASHTVLSVASVEKYEAVLSVMREQGCDAVILVRSPGKRGTGKPLRGRAAPSPLTLSEQWQEYYLQGYPAIPAYSWQREHHAVEADLCEPATGRSVWKATFEITTEGPVVREMVPLVSVMVKQLRADRMVR